MTGEDPRINNFVRSEGEEFCDTVASFIIAYIIIVIYIVYLCFTFRIFFVINPLIFGML